MMLRRARNAVVHTWTIFTALFSGRWRRVLVDAWRLERSLPWLLDEHPLPRVMEILTAQDPPAVEPRVKDRERIRAIADAVVAYDVGSRLGYCLRQSLVRYNLLYREGVPVFICFGARKHAGTVLHQAKLTGHAWLVLRGIPYAEDHQHYRDFTIMLTYPESRQLKLEL
jgi:hypothetical protein